MSYTQTWVIDGEMLVSEPIGPEYIRGEKHPAFSLAFFCPVCGDVWARRIISPETRWNVLTHECSKHRAPRYCEPSGSVWINYNQEYIAHLPKTVLKREALIFIGASDARN